ncbi:hypothetical protein [Streptomyces sp. NPDC048650]|uniref:hypothetical protein n=1 Tax=Streptomyces sp. NPDC048650 TaxID=3365583 RepID=UPI0037222E3D
MASVIQLDPNRNPCLLSAQFHPTSEFKNGGFASYARRIGAGALALGALSGGMIFASAAPAAAIGGCQTFSQAYYPSEAKVSMRLGHVKMRIQICENGKGDITDSRAWGEDSTTAPAKLTGWELKLNGPYQSGKSKTIVEWKATGKAQTCLMGKLPVCSYGEDFEVSGKYYSTSFIGPVAGGKGKVHWKPKCTNKYCKLKFNKSM